MSALFHRTLVLDDLPVMSHVMAAMWCLKDLCTPTVSNFTVLSARWDVAIWHCVSLSSFLKAFPAVPPGNGERLGVTSCGLDERAVWEGR